MQANGNTSRLLEGKVALVTGGSTGIGEAISKLFARHGASVLVNGLPGDPAAEVAGEINESGGVASADLSDVGTLAGSTSCVERAVATYGRLDCVVANAGFLPESAEVPDVPLDHFEQVIHSNVLGTFYTLRAAIPHLQESRGSIVTLGSEAGILGIPEAAAYSGTKGFVIMFTRAVAAEQAKYGVRANVVAPGPIDTEMTRPTKGNLSFKLALLAVEAVPLGRRGQPEEVANVCLFLASDLASFVTGSVYSVDGGSTCTHGLPGLEAKRSVKKDKPEGTVELEHQHEGRNDLREPRAGTPRSRQ